MKRTGLLLLLGLVVLSVSAGAAAHDRGSGAYGGSGTKGHLTVWGGSYGPSGFSGSLQHGFGRGWQPLPYPVHVHGPVCGHAPRHGGSWRKGHRHGHKHWRRHHYGHYPGHHRGHYRGHHRGHGRKHRRH